MDLSKIDFGLGLKGVVMGEKSRQKNLFKGKPLDITERFEKVMVLYLFRQKADKEVFILSTTDEDGLCREFKISIKEVFDGDS